jgi:hypothetical protein
MSTSTRLAFPGRPFRRKSNGAKLQIVLLFELWPHLNGPRFRA